MFFPLAISGQFLLVLLIFLFFASQLRFRHQIFALFDLSQRQFVTGNAELCKEFKEVTLTAEDSFKNKPLSLFSQGIL